MADYNVKIAKFRLNSEPIIYLLKHSCCIEDLVINKYGYSWNKFTKLAVS